MKDRLHTYEIDQPWVTYLYLTTDRRTRITGRSRIECECLVCGRAQTISIRIPRFGPVPEGGGEPDGKHPARKQFLFDHRHPDKPDPADWAKPLGNMAAWPNGIPMGLFERVVEVARMEAAEQEP
jgi:hypothetical protein